MQNETIEKSFEAPPKWQTIVALVFSLFTILPVLPVILSLFTVYPGKIIDNIANIIIFIFYYGGFLFGATAFILGIMGLKYRKNALAITAIVVSVVGFISNMYFYDISRSQPLP